MGAVVVETAVEVSTVAIFDAAENDLTRLSFEGVGNNLFALDWFFSTGKFVENGELEAEQRNGGIFGDAGLRVGDGLAVTGAVERADDENDRVGVALENAEASENFVDGGFTVLAFDGNDLNVVNADDELFVGAGKWRELADEIVDVFAVKFENAQIEVGVTEFVDGGANSHFVVEIFDVGVQIGGGKVGGGVVVGENGTCDGFSEHGFFGHFVGAVDAGAALTRQILKQLPDEGSFAHGGLGAENVKPRHQQEVRVEIPKAAGNFVKAGILFKIANAAVVEVIVEVGGARSVIIAP